LKDQKLIKDFEQESRVISKLKHPNVVQYYGITEVNNQFFIVMEFCNLGGLDVIVAGNDLSVATLTDMAIQAASGMKYLSDNKIVHRDLGLRNVLVSGTLEKPNVKVSDFGLSRLTQEGIYHSDDRKQIPVKVSSIISSPFLVECS
jgi:serine/threonine protein kinase